MLRSLLPDVPPVRLEAYAEFFASAADIARVHADEDGRALGERALPRPLREKVDVTLRRCGYPGSRHGRPMNVSGLRTVTAHWDVAVRTAIALRRRYLERAGIERLPWVHVWLFGRTLTAVPAFLVRRSEGRARTVPNEVSALFKPAIGLYMTAERALLGGIDPLAVPTPSEFIAVTEDSGAFLSEDAACSGPPHLVREWAEAVLNGAGTDGGGEMTPVDAEPLLDYGDAISRMELLKVRYFLETRIQLQRFARSLAPVPGEPGAAPMAAKGFTLDAGELEAFARLVAMLGDALGLTAPARAATAAEAVTAQAAWAALFTERQAEVDRTLGRAPARESPLAPADLARMAAYVDATWDSAGRAAIYDLAARLRTADEAETETT
ncbi:hypothetical protein [Actinoallomurus sp. CA-142502]|uniref:hypothetical protein n=1 Tax=Actinoallomurus sp. CA-142502 TaxID=3239885 RepID=UPI003D8D971D